MLKELIIKNRSYRRFNQTVSISRMELAGFIDLARLSSSGANLQPLKYIISNTDEKNEQIFKHLKWAGYLPDWSGPEEGEKPTSYIIMLHDQNISKHPFWDHGIAAQSIMLGATEKGYGGCMFGAINKTGLIESLDIPSNFEVLMVLGIGEPVEEVVLENLGENESIKYYRDNNNVHHVPKRSLESLIID